MRVINLAIATFAIFAIFGCGGGSGSKDAVTGETKDYLGSITPGDFIELSKTGDIIEYTISGEFFKDISGSTKVKEVPDSNNTLFTGIVNSEEAGFLLTDNLFISSMYIDSGYRIAIGLQEPETALTKTDFVGNYTYLEVNFDDGDLEDSIYCGVEVKDDNSAEFTCGGGTGAIRWDIIAGGRYVLAKKGLSTTPVMPKTADVNIIVAKDAKGFIVDKKDGSGFGIAVRNEHTNKADLLGEYIVIDYHEGEFSTISLEDSKTVGSDIEATMSGAKVGEIKLNQDCTSRAVDGLMCVIDDDGKEHLGVYDSSNELMIVAAIDGSNFIMLIKK
jgi:hypothetical protein